MNDREALAAHGVFCMSLAAGVAAGVVLNFLLGLALYINVVSNPDEASAGRALLWPTVISMKAGAVLGAALGCWALHRLYWRSDDQVYRRRCARVGLVITFEIFTAAALALAIVLVQPAMAKFWSPRVLPLLCIALLFPVLFFGYVISMRLMARLLSIPVGPLDRNALDNPQDSAGQMIAGLTRLALSPLVAAKATFDGIVGFFKGLGHLDLGNNRSDERKKPMDPS